MAKYSILGLYFLVLFLIGILAARKVNNIKDYFVGGKNLGYWVAAFSSRATGSSAWALLGLTGMGSIFGISAYWVVAGTLLGETIAWFVMAKPFKRLTDQYNSITIPDYLVSRFHANGQALRVISATALSLFVIIYVSAQIDATGTAFESFLNWNYFAGAVVGFLIVVVYMSFGGFLAVAWSDVFQGLIMLLGLVVLPIVTVLTIENPDTIFLQLRETDPGLLNIWGRSGFSLENFSRITGFVMIGLGFLGSPQLFVRFMSMKSEASINKGKWVSVVLTFFMNTSAVTIGILGRFIFTSAGDDPVAILGNGGQNVLIMLVDEVMPVAVAGFYISAVLSAIMSTIDSLLVVASSAITRDFYQQIFNPDISDKKLTRISQGVTFLMSFLALTIAILVAVFSPTRTIFWFVIFGWSGIAATFCPVIILSLFWKKFTEKGAIAAMVTGFVGVPVFKFLVPAIPSVGVYFNLVAELLPSFILALLIGFLVSFKDSAPQKIVKKVRI